MNFNPHQYLLEEEYDRRSAELKSPWLASRYKGSLFISHIGLDYNQISNIIYCQEINERFGTAFFLHNKNSGYVSTYKELVRFAIHLCDKFIAVISCNSVANEWVSAEVAFALMNNRFIIICLLDDTDPIKLNIALTKKNKLIHPQFIDFRNDEETVKMQLIKVLDEALSIYPYRHP